MPGFMDILGNLDAHSNLILDAASENNVHDGAFVNAYLRGLVNLSSTIREAQSHEVKLFKFVGEQVGGTGKVVEKRDKGLVTPLKKAGFGNRINMAVGGVGSTTPATRYAKERPDQGSNWDDPQILLNTAFTLTEEYRAMPRAKAHIKSLLDHYIETQNKICELEAAIEQVSSGKDRDEPSATDGGREEGEGAKSEFATPEEWFKAEEAALKALELEVTERRRQKPQSPQTANTPLVTRRKPSTPGSASPLLPQLRKGMTPSADSPLLTTSMHPGFVSDNLNTPTPNPQPGTAPASVFRRPLGRPTASTVSRAMEATRGQIKTISTAAKNSVLSNNRSPVPAVTPSPPSVKRPATVASSRVVGTNRTLSPKIKAQDSPKSTAAKTWSPLRVDATQAEAARAVGKPGTVATSDNTSTPTKQPPNDPPAQTLPAAAHESTQTPRTKQRKAVAGVEIRSDTKRAIDKIWDVFSEVMRSDEELQTSTDKPDPEQSIRILAKLADSVPQPPMSPSSVSTMSNPALRLSVSRVVPLTTLSILQCVAVLNVLRAPNMNISKNELSETMTAHAVAKGWDKALGQKALLGCVGRRIVKIDRRGPGGGTVMFNL
ncbi:hypothetical protein QFC24_004927 [Naganishia onofrii]|uniref:Uncharacterized protein n=1 Tax=Naganishia onofrii TaxID=1851511 RepID=A0ACC2XC86_9TREE|nr:hypothetical protein QFC24_004927 [Naganishia onofrii]